MEGMLLIKIISDCFLRPLEILNERFVLELPMFQ